MQFSRRRFLEAATALAAAGPIAACRDSGSAEKAAEAVAATGWQDAVSMVASMEDGDTTALKLVNDAIYRLEQVNERINAVALPNFEKAREEAETGTTGQLAGVPTVTKDNLMVEGMPYTQGSRALKDYVANETAPFAVAMQNAGLISIGRSTLPEFGMTATTEPVLTGITRNPWDLDRSTGGSSGGSAACVAAGVVPIAHANDGGGSIRIPAAACGLVGLKASRGRMFGHETDDSATDLGVQGFVTRTVRDTAAGFHAAQGGPLFPAAKLVIGPDERRLRIAGRINRAGTEEMPDAETQRVFEETMTLLSTMGHTVSTDDGSWVEPTIGDDFLNLWSYGAALRVKSASEMGGIPEGADLTQYFEPLMLGMAKRGASLSEAERNGVVERLEAFKNAYRARFDDVDVMVTPVLGQPAAPIGYISPTSPYDADSEKRLEAYAGYTGSENAAGLPAIALPVGMTSGNVPVSLQFIAAPGEEPMLLALAYELEEKLRWYERKPPVWVGDEGVKA